METTEDQRPSCPSRQEAGDGCGNNLPEGFTSNHRGRQSLIIGSPLSTWLRYSFDQMNSQSILNRKTLQRWDSESDTLAFEAARCIERYGLNHVSP